MYCLFSSKGGVGCSVAAASLALLSARQRPTLLVDLRGDLDTIIGLRSGTDGLTEWFGVDEPSPDLLRRLEQPVTSRLTLLPRGSGRSPARPERYRLLARLLGRDHRCVVVDVGTHAVPAIAVLAEATTTLLVTRPCFLALDAARTGPTPDRIVLVSEPGRALGRGDVSSCIGAPIAAELGWSASVARAVDSGLLAARLPRELRRLTEVLQ